MGEGGLIIRCPITGGREPEAVHQLHAAGAGGGRRPGQARDLHRVPQRDAQRLARGPELQVRPPTLLSLSLSSLLLWWAMD